MLEPLLNLMSPARRARALHAPLVAWGEAHGLAFSSGKEGACSLAGEWGGRPVRIDVQPASRSYMDGQELSARCDLGLDPLASVIVMNRFVRAIAAVESRIALWDGLRVSMREPLAEVAQ